MRVSTLVFALAASLASAQSIADLPECALSCLAQVDTGGCDITDQLCLCKSQAFFTSSTTCVRKTCSPADDQKTAQVSAAICQALGVTLPSPPASSPGETTPASAPASTPAATVSATSVASSTHDHPSSAAGGAGAPATTHTGTASAPGTPNTSGAPTVSGAAATTASHAVTGSASGAAPSPTKQGNAAWQNVGGKGVAVAAGLAAAAAMVL